MGNRRPRRRGDWSRHLPPITNYSPVTSDSDLFPSDSGSSSDSLSSNDYLRHSNKTRKKPSSQFSPLSVTSTAIPSRPDIFNAPKDYSITRHSDSLSTLPINFAIRDLTLSEYTSQELPDLRLLLRGIIPSRSAFHSSPLPPRSPSVPQSANSHLQRRRSAPVRPRNPYPHSPLAIHSPANRPPTFPNPPHIAHSLDLRVTNPTQFYQKLAAAREQFCKQGTIRNEAEQQIRRTSIYLRPNTEQGLALKRFPHGNVTIEPPNHQNDPDSMHRSLLLERVCFLFKSLCGSRTEPRPRRAEQRRTSKPRVKATHKSTRQHSGRRSSGRQRHSRRSSQSLR